MGGASRLIGEEESGTGLSSSCRVWSGVWSPLSLDTSSLDITRDAWWVSSSTLSSSLSSRIFLVPVGVVTLIATDCWVWSGWSDEEVWSGWSDEGVWSEGSGDSAVCVLMITEPVASTGEDEPDNILGRVVTTDPSPPPPPSSSPSFVSSSFISSFILLPTPPDDRELVTIATSPSFEAPPLFDTAGEDDRLLLSREEVGGVSDETLLAVVSS